jgi:hypothetical protein
MCKRRRTGLFFNHLCDGGPCHDVYDFGIEQLQICKTPFCRRIKVLSVHRSNDYVNDFVAQRTKVACHLEESFMTFLVPERGPQIDMISQFDWARAFDEGEVFPETGILGYFQVAAPTRFHIVHGGEGDWTWQL